MTKLYIKNLFVSFLDISMFLIPYLVFYYILNYGLFLSILIPVIAYVMAKADLRTEDDIKKLYNKIELDKLKEKVSNVRELISKNKE